VALDSIHYNIEGTKMSELYASITQSARKTVPTARGHKSTGISAEVCAWSGKIVSTIEWSELDKDYRFTVTMEPHHGAGDSCIIASGIVGKYEQSSPWITSEHKI
tara:strand:- start:258 stop:572 length:315 start_codon:yes stop_codon:yes gene_type:complete